MNSSIKNDGDKKKFLFDTNDFDKPAPEPKVDVTYSEEQLLLAKNQGYAQGKADGASETKTSQEQQANTLLMQVAGLLEKLLAAEERRDLENMMNATKLAMRITHKLLPQMADKFALQEIERVILASLDVRKDEPRIAVFIPTQHLDNLKARVDNLALERGFAGKLILIADDALPAGDCRVEWADGGAERSYERLFSQIENEFAKAMTAMKTTHTPHGE